MLAIKGGMVSDFAGKSINLNPNNALANLHIDPKIEKTKDLLCWFQDLDEDSRSELRSISRDVTIDSNPVQNEFFD